MERDNKKLDQRCETFQCSPLRSSTTACTHFVKTDSNMSSHPLSFRATSAGSNKIGGSALGKRKVEVPRDKFDGAPTESGGGMMGRRYRSFKELEMMRMVSIGWIEHRERAFLPNP
jgi:hypothetical protein